MVILIPIPNLQATIGLLGLIERDTSRIRLWKLTGSILSNFCVFMSICSDFSRSCWTDTSYHPMEWEWGAYVCKSPGVDVEYRSEWRRFPHSESPDWLQGCRQAPSPRITTNHDHETWGNDLPMAPARSLALVNSKSGSAGCDGVRQRAEDPNMQFAGNGGCSKMPKARTAKCGGDRHA